MENLMLNLHIVTPSRKVLSTTCENVVLPGFDGDMGILSAHAPLVNKLGAGVVVIHGGAEASRLAIAGGVLEISNDEVTVLADEAIFPSEVNATKLEAEQKILSEKLLTVSEGSSDRKVLFEKQRWITAQFEILKN